MSKLDDEIKKEVNHIVIKYGIIGVIVGVLVYFAYFH